jgi:hypothetical protein
MEFLRQLREIIPSRAKGIAALVKKDDEENRLNMQRELEVEENKIDSEIAMQEPALFAARQTEREAEEIEKAAAADVRAAKSVRENLQFTFLGLRGRRDAIKAKRAALCSSLITNFISDQLKLFDQTRLRGETEERAVKMATGFDSHSYVSNYAGIKESLARIGAAIKEAEQLKYSILTDAEVAERLEAIKPIIPDTFFSE